MNISIMPRGTLIGLVASGTSLFLVAIALAMLAAASPGGDDRRPVEKKQGHSLTEQQDKEMLERDREAREFYKIGYK